MELSLILNYDIKEDKFDDSQGNIKPERRKDFVFDFLRTQFGAGADDSKPKKRDNYTIRLDLNLNGDIYTVSDNCGNKGLRGGILARYIAEC